MWISHRKEIRKLTFRAQALRRSESRNCGLCEVYIQKYGATLLAGAWQREKQQNKLVEWKAFVNTVYLRAGWNELTAVINWLSSIRPLNIPGKFPILLWHFWILKFLSKATVYAPVCTTNPPIPIVICCIHLHIHRMSRILFLILSFLDFAAFVVKTLISP